MPHIRGKQVDRFLRRHRVPRERRIRHDPHKRRLRERACGPPRARILPEPALRPLVAFMRRPQQRDQHIRVQQNRRHFCSASSSRTFFVVTRGDSGGKSNTCTPFTSFVGRGTVKARCTRSLTASPSVSDRLAAYRFTNRNTSSSSDSVVLIATIVPINEGDVKLRKEHHLYRLMCCPHRSSRTQQAASLFRVRSCERVGLRT